MAGLPPILEILARRPEPLVDRAIAAALPTASHADQAHLVDLLLSRGHPAGTVALVEHYEHLAPPAQEVVRGRIGDLFRPIREAAGMALGRGPFNALTLIRASHEARLVYVVIDLLRRGTPSVRRAAAATLLHLALAPMTPGARRQVQDAVEEAVGLYRHHEQPAVMEAMFALLPRPLPRALTHLGDWRTPAASVCRDHLAAAATPLARQALLPLLPVVSLASAVLRGVERCLATGQWDDLLHHGHLLDLPPYADAAARIPPAIAAKLWPTAAELPTLAPAAARHLPRLALALPLDEPARVERLLTVAAHGDLLARLAALRAVVALGRRAAARRRAAALQPAGDDAAAAVPVPPRALYEDAVARFADDADPLLVRLALRELTRHQYQGLATLLPRLVNGPHAPVRELAARCLAPLAFARLWDAWPRLTRTQRAAGARGLLKIDTDVQRRVAQRLTSAQRDERLRAVALLDALHLAPAFEDTLVPLAADPDAKLASAAVKALAGSPSAAAAAALDRALGHADARVRANAVEALDQLQRTRHLQQLLAMAQRDEQRPRANAIRALVEMRVDHAAAALTRMLADPRPAHRRSALWVAEQVGLLEVARHVADVAVGDPDADLRRRARRVIDGLVQALQPAATPPPPPSAVTAAAAVAPLALQWTLAQADDAKTRDYFLQISDHFTRGSLVSPWWLVVLVGFLITLIALVTLRGWLRIRAAEKTTRRLFGDVATELGVRPADRRRLARIARHQKLPTPLTLLLSASTLEHHAHAYAQDLTPRGQARVARALTRLLPLVHRATTAR